MALRPKPTGSPGIFSSPPFSPLFPSYLEGCQKTLMDRFSGPPGFKTITDRKKRGNLSFKRLQDFPVGMSPQGQDNRVRFQAYLSFFTFHPNPTVANLLYLGRKFHPNARGRQAFQE